MAVASKSNAVYIGPTADMAGILVSVQPGDFYFNDETGVMYRADETHEAWTAIDAGEVTVGTLTISELPEVAAATVTQVGDAATNTTLKAANAARNGLTIYNVSSAALYVKLGATAAIATSYTTIIPANGYWEMPVGRAIYTGIVDGIWASDAGGSALVTEW